MAANSVFINAAIGSGSNPFDQSLDMADSPTFGGISIVGDATVGDDLTVTDHLAVGGDAAVTGNTTLTGTLAVTSTSAFTGAVSLAAVIKLTPSATLNASPAAGMLQTVNTASVPTIGLTVSLGGAAFALVCYNGTAWKVVAI